MQGLNGKLAVGELNREASRMGTHGRGMEQEGVRRSDQLRSTSQMVERCDQSGQCVSGVRFIKYTAREQGQSG